MLEDVLAEVLDDVLEERLVELLEREDVLLDVSLDSRELVLVE